MVWIDIIFIAILIICAIIGLVKGLLDSVLGLVSGGAALFLAIWLAKPFTALIRKIIDIDGLSNNLLQSWGVAETTSFLGIAEVTRNQIATFMSLILCAVVLFLLIKVLVWVLSKLFGSAISGSTALSGLNRVFGLIFGVARGLFTCCIVLAICSVLSFIQPLGQTVTDAINSTTITRFTYGYVDDYVQGQISGDKFQDLLEEFNVVSYPKIEVETDKLGSLKTTFVQNETPDFSTNQPQIAYYNASGTKTYANLTLDMFNGTLVTSSVGDSLSAVITYSDGTNTLNCLFIYNVTASWQN